MAIRDFGSKEERSAILTLWGQKQSTWNIGRLLGRKESYIESQLHLALDRRWSVKSSLGARD